MNRLSRHRIILFFLAFSIMTLFTNVPYAADLSNKWRIKVNHNADSEGTIAFRVSPDGQPAIDVNVEIKDNIRENLVAVAIRDAFKAQLPEDGYHVERDDFEDVLIKKRGDTPNFGLELVSNNVQGVSIKMHKE